MEIIPFDSSRHSGIRCPESGLEIDFEDENITDYIGDTFVMAVLLRECPEECAIGGPLDEAWQAFYRAHEDEHPGLEELIEAFPGPYKALEVSRGGMACGPISEVVYYVVPKDGEIVPLRHREPGSATKRSAR